MLPAFASNGLLPAGIHAAMWHELDPLAGTAWRLRLIDGFRRACAALAVAGCQQVWLDGSFISTKDAPGDFDGCWDPRGVNPALLDPVLLDFTNRRAAQKAKYGGELFIATADAVLGGRVFLDFFQFDKDTGQPKGILLLDPRDA